MKSGIDVLGKMMQEVIEHPFSVTKSIILETKFGEKFTVAKTAINNFVGKILEDKDQN